MPRLAGQSFLGIEVEGTRLFSRRRRCVCAGSELSSEQTGRRPKLQVRSPAENVPARVNHRGEGRWGVSAAKQEQNGQGSSRLSAEGKVQKAAHSSHRVEQCHTQQVSSFSHAKRS